MTHLRAFAGAGLMIILCMLWSSEVGAQSTTAQLSGTITDSSGAIVPGVKVTVRNTDTEATRVVETNPSGLYTVLMLPPGNYSLAAEKAGFESQRANLVLQVNQALVLDLSIGLGRVTQAIEVSAAAQQLQAESTELGSVISEKAVLDLPLNGRNFTQLLTLTPGATPVSTGQAAKIGGGNFANPGIPGSAFSQPSVNGQWNRSNFYLMDGLNDSAFFASTYAVLPIVDAIQEFKVQSHNDDAQYGSVTGGVLNVVIKSGTNDVHGSGWEFLRNNIFDARNPFTDGNSKSAAPYRQNQFGATIGGPVYAPKVYKGRNKTWFFFAYEGWRYRKPTGSLLRLPTSAELAGDFSREQTIFDPSTTRLGADGKTQVRDPFPSNQIPASRISAMSLSFFKTLYDQPNFTGVSSVNYMSPGSQQNDGDTYIGKLDQRFSEKNSAWFRYSRMYPTIYTPSDSKVSAIDTEYPVNWGGGDTHVFRPNLLLDLRFGYASRHVINGTVTNDGTSIYKSMGFQGLDRFGVADLVLQTPWSGFGIAGPLNQLNRAYNLSGTVTWVRGSHTITGGYQLIWTNYSCCATGPGYGQRNQYVFNNAQTANPAQPGNTGASLASALLGLPTSVYFAAQNYALHYQNWSPFISDKWRVTSRLTLTAGLRYDYVNTPKLDKGTISELDPETGNWLVGGGKFPTACSTAGAAPCIPGTGDVGSIPYGGKIVVAKNPNVGPNPVHGNFGPRIGLAFRLQDKTAVRAGYGIMFDTLNGVAQTFQAMEGNWPDATNIQTTYNAAGSALTTLASLQQSAASLLPASSPWSTNNYMFDPNLKNSRSQQWNLDVQRQLTQDVMLSVGYVGSHNNQLPVLGLFNVSPVAGLGTAGVPYPWASATQMTRSIGVANYNALQVKLERRYSHGLQTLISYTWSKAMENGGSGWYGSAENGSGGSSDVQNFYDLSKNWGPAGYDVTHYMSAAIQYDLPVGRGRQLLTAGPLGHILENWQINLISTARSGQPYNMVVTGDVANVGSKLSYNYARPNLVGNANLAHPTAQMFFNKDAFSIPVNTFGSLGQNAMRALPVYDMDVSLFKTIRLGEKRDLQFRAEAFNILNLQNLGVPGTTYGSASFGVVSSTVVVPREIQLGLKLRF